MKTSTQRILTTLTFVCLAAVGPKAQAVSPAPDGAYPGGNTAEGQNALFSLTTGGFNTALGWFSAKSDTTGSFNTAVGAATLFASTADQNTAVGAGALLSDTTGAFNSATGAFALLNNTTGGFNTANGDYALSENTTGSLNTAIGYQALLSNTTGIDNTATGYAALARSTSMDNTADGYAALAFNTSGFDNTAIGSNALLFNTNGDFNTALGRGALENITTGLNNIAVGDSAGLNHTGDDGQNIDIGNLGVAGDSRTTRIGASQLRTFIAGINGTAVSGTAVFVDSNGQLGVATSSRRFKDEIKPMNKASEAILALKPVTFRYKPEIDPKRAPQFGLVAEDVAKVNPDLVLRDADGKVYTVRYDAVNAMLLNEFLKEHYKVEQMQKQIEELTAVVQKVSAQLEVSKPASQTVLNSH
jgi:Chaperone of endosialidase